MKHVITSEKLFSIINDKGIKLLDSRWFLPTTKLYGIKEFEKGHIPNATFFDIDLFSDINSSLPHTIPSKLRFEKLIKKFGIDRNSHIIIYDQNGFFSSTRSWFIFHLFGHKKISILDGGFNDWIRKKFPVTKNYLNSKKKNYKSTLHKDKLISMNEIKYIIDNKLLINTIVDARPSNRFKGLEEEPRKDLRKGTIPNSINIPFHMIHDRNGYLHKKVFLKKIFYEDNKLNDNNNIICSCGSGVTACNIFFALEILNHSKKQLYDGSWSEWGKIEKKN